MCVKLGTRARRLHSVVSNLEPIPQRAALCCAGCWAHSLGAFAPAANLGCFVSNRRLGQAMCASEGHTEIAPGVRAGQLTVGARNRGCAAILGKDGSSAEPRARGAHTSTLREAEPRARGPRTSTLSKAEPRPRGARTSAHSKAEPRARGPHTGTLSKAEPRARGARTSKTRWGRRTTPRCCRGGGSRASA